ncbi:MAG TPA: HAD domain-containing protein [Pyrinomonadaceae bacterium]|jgi:hypothetical protein
MKLIFLDIDGCLNSERFYRDRHEGRNDAKSRKHPYSEIDYDGIGLLNNLIKETGTKVVISSTWRLGRTTEQFQEFFKKCGFKGEIIDITPDLRRGEFHDSIFRGNEVHAWMEKNRGLLGKELHKFRDYVIFDDDSDFLYWQRNNLIIVDGSVGLTRNTIYKAKRILNRDE